MRRTAMLVLFLSLAGCQGAAATPGYTDISPTELAAMLEAKDFFFVNTHIPYEGEIAQTDAFIPYDDLDAQPGLWPEDKEAPIVLYCRSGRMSAIAAEALVAQGYTRVYNLAGGMIAWEEAGLPLIRR